jgi:hypothetical protein
MFLVAENKTAIFYSKILQGFSCLEIRLIFSQPGENYLKSSKLCRNSKHKFATQVFCLKPLLHQFLGWQSIGQMLSRRQL